MMAGCCGVGAVVLVVRVDQEVWRADFSKNSNSMSNKYNCNDNNSMGSDEAIAIRPISVRRLWISYFLADEPSTLWDKKLLEQSHACCTHVATCTEVIYMV